MRVLVLGATGMLGHKLAQVIRAEHDVHAAFRGTADAWPRAIEVAGLHPGIDVQDHDALAGLLDRNRPDAVLNAVGVVKQVIGSDDRVDTIAINAFYPNVLADLCARRRMRLIHYSTDCVFSGAASGLRGVNGYRETDPPDARDLYGLSKLLGEPVSQGSLVLRTSIIGRELRGRHSLVEWFLAQGEGPIQGFEKALFTGLTTLELAHVTAMVLRDHPEMTGLWNVATAPIDKFTLLGLLKVSFARPTVIHPQSDFYCDRRLDASRFSAATGWHPAPWPALIEAMRTHPLDDASASG